MKLSFVKNRNQRFGKSRSMMHITLEIMIPVFALFAALLVFMFASVHDAEQMAYRYIQDTAALNVTRANEDIDKINSEMVYLIQQDKNIESLPDRITPQMTQYYKLLSDIITMNKNLRIKYGGNYFFYEYVKESDFLILDNHNYFVSSTKSGQALGLENMIKGYLSGEIQRSEWNYFSADGETYLFCFYEVKGKAVGCIINLEDLFVNFNISNLGYEGIPFLILDNGEILMQKKEELREAVTDALDEKGCSKSTIYAYQLGRLGNLNLLIASTEGILDKILFLQIVSVAMTAGIILIGSLIAFSYYQQILAPMRSFVKKLSDPKEEKWLHDAEGHHLMELEMASKEFREMLRQIQSLKIAIYEKELLQSKTELEYVQEQIKPHFFLNCISVIHGMAEMIHAQDIISISEKLSSYMRYVVNDSYSLRELGQEIGHIKDYIDIQKLRYGDSFQFEMIVDPELESCQIPPLVLQVFVENAINHGVSFEKQTEITLYIVAEKYKGEDYLYICISDTGDGFSDDILDKIKAGENIEYSGRKHIGIQNTLKRLQIMYGNRAEVSFFNMAKHCGAVVELRLPRKAGV